MLRTVRHALALISPRHRRRLLLTLPWAVAVALLEAGGFGILFVLLRLLVDPGQVTAGPVGAVYRASGVSDPGTFLWVLGAAVFALLLIKEAAAVALLWWQSRLLAEAEADLAVRLFDHYMHAPHHLHVSRNSATMIRNVQGSVTVIFQNVMLSAVTVASEAFVVAAVAVVFLTNSPAVGLIVLGLIAVATVTYTRGLGRLSRRLGRENQRLMRVLQQRLHESLGGAPMFQVLNRQGTVTERFTEERRDFARVRQRFTFVNQLPRYYLETLLLAGLGMLALGVSLFSSDTDLLASFGVLLAVTLRMMPSLNKILSSLNRIQVGAAATRQVRRELEVLEGMEDQRVVVTTADALPLRDRLAIEGITFTYEGSPAPALADVDLTIRPGEKVGIVGPSGSGKSTLVNILLGLSWPQRGSVTVDGVRLGRHNLSAWRRTLGFVPQDIFIADATLRENVALGTRPAEIDDARVTEVLHLAQLGELLEELPEGLDTRLGERGARLSGGQRQRVGIARALYNRPAVLLLDEATSSLDPVTEAAVTATVEALSGRLTIIVVAHRLSTVRGCDRLVVLRNGRVVGIGPYDELARDNEVFAALVGAHDAVRHP